jgi:hypothetical protein
MPFYLAETRDINALRSKKFGKRDFLDLLAGPVAKLASNPVPSAHRPSFRAREHPSPSRQATVETIQRKSWNVDILFP